MNQGAGDHEATAITAGQGIRLGVGEWLQPELLQQGGYPRLELRRAGAKVATHLLQIAAHGKVVIKGIVLGADAHLPGGGIRVDAPVNARYPDYADVGLQKAVAHPQSRRFSGPVSAQQTNDLTRQTAQVHSVHHAAARELLDQAGGQQGRFMWGVQIAVRERGHSRFDRVN